MNWILQNPVIFSVISRILVYFTSVATGLLLSDHIPSGAESLNLLYTSRLNENFLACFSKWDAVYFLKIALYGYTDENELAFFPLFPTIVRHGALSLRGLDCLNDTELLICFGLIWNSVAFVASTYILYQLLLQFNLSPNIVAYAVLCFIWNPANIFFLTLYTESLFTFLTLSGFYLHLSSDQYPWWSCIVPLTLASCARSNGNLNCVIILIVGGQNICRTIVQYYAVNVNKRGDNTGIRENNALAKSTAKTLSKFTLTVISEATKTVVITTCILLPYCIHNYIAYGLMCDVNMNTQHATYGNGSILNILIYFKNSLYTGTFIPSQDTLDTYCVHMSSVTPYAYIQYKYWNVGLFQYYQFKQIPNFMLAMPITMIALFVLYHYYAMFMNKVYSVLSGVKKSDVVASTATIKSIFRKRSLLLTLLCNEVYLPYCIHLLLLVIVAYLYAHIQITTRLLCSSSPLIYVGMAYLINSKWETVRLVTLVYIIVFNIMGIALHVNNYPWT